VTAGTNFSKGDDLMKKIKAKLPALLAVAVIGVCAFLVLRTEGVMPNGAESNSPAASQTQRDSADIFFDSLPLDNAGLHIFPDYFGGIHRRNDGVIVIQVVRTYAPSYADAAELFDHLGLTDVVFELVEFSYNEIHSLMNYLAQYMQEYADNNMPLMFGSVSWDVLENRVRVNLREYNARQMELFKNNVIDSPMITFGRHFDVVALPRQQPRFSGRGRTLADLQCLLCLRTAPCRGNLRSPVGCDAQLNKQTIQQKIQHTCTERRGRRSVQ